MTNTTKKFCAAEVMFGLVELEFRLWWILDFYFEGRSLTLFFLLHILSSLVNVRLHTEN
jgi:hypothetical protein